MEQIIPFIAQYRYLALFPLAALQGPIFALVVGFLVYLGTLDFPLSLIILVLSDVATDTIYYYIGRVGNQKRFVQKYISRWNLISKHFKTLDKLWHQHARKTMTFSKLSWGLSAPFLITAGLVKIPFRKFIKYAVPVAILEYVTLMTVGYLLGQSYQLAVKYIKFGGFIIAVFLILFTLFYNYFSKFAKKQITMMEESEEKLET